MRSSPAKASVICVPIVAISTSGMATNAGEKYVHEKVAERHAARQDIPAADKDQNDPNNADDDRGESHDARNCRHRPGYVAKQSMRAAREDQFLAFLRRIGFDNADAAERLCQTAGHFSIDFATFAKHRPQFLKRNAIIRQMLPARTGDRRLIASSNRREHQRRARQLPDRR